MSPQFPVPPTQKFDNKQKKNGGGQYNTSFRINAVGSIVFLFTVKQRAQTKSQMLNRSSKSDMNTDSFWSRFNSETQKIDSEIKHFIATPQKSMPKTIIQKQKSGLGGLQKWLYH